VKKVVVVSLGREQAMGEVRRVASWRQVFGATGAEVLDRTVAPGRMPRLDGVLPVVTGRAAPERLAWSGDRLYRSLCDDAPDVVVVVSTRAFDLRILDGPWTVVLDQVDSLARSYHDRVAVVDGLPRRTMYQTLSVLHARVERKIRDAPVRRVAAGWADALTLGAEWVPNTLDDTLAPLDGVEPDHELLFFGTLRYPPNVDALERLARMWPRLQASRPGTTAIVAGAAPVPRVRDLCLRHGWELVPDFTSLPAVGARARVAVAPLSRVAGIQNKVLDAAAIGLPQVVTPEALEGFDPGLPLVGLADDAAFVAEVVRLLQDRDAARAQVVALGEHVRHRYSTEAWRGWASAVSDHSA
jgi:hypothetical protein